MRIISAALLTKLLLAAHATVLSVGVAHATVFSFSSSSIGDVDVTLTDATTSGQVDFSIDSSGLTPGLDIRAIFFTVDFDVNAGSLGLPLLSVFDPNNAFFSYGVDEGGFNPATGISADSRLGFGTNGVNTGGLDSTESFGGVFQRFNIPGDLTVLNFTQVAIQVGGEGFFADPDPAAVPVPASLPLIAGGLGMAGFVLRRRKRKA